ESEYRVATRLERMPFTGARWVMGERPVSDLKLPLDGRVFNDLHGNPVVLVETSWSLSRLVDNNPDFTFRTTSPGPQAQGTRAGG
ncbi:MAG: hypothetical protein EBS99_13580, partial [Betaproteobacteria bacterium]|nr:hypothetical protein [Betaproteobacteria bacterium]